MEPVSTMNLYGITTEEACNAAYELSKRIPKLSEQDVYLIEQNPSLSLKEKYKIKKEIRKEIYKGKEEKRWEYF